MIQVNGKTVSIPSYQVRVGDVITVKPEKKDNGTIKLMAENVKVKNIVSWIEMDKDKLEAKIVRVPVRADVDLEVAENLIIELYSKN